MSDNEEYEEGEEELEEDEAREEEEEDEEGGSERGAKKRRVFAEVLPEPKEAIDSLMLLLPGKGSTKVEVMVRLSETRRSFEKAYAPALRRLKRTNILAQLNEANDVDGLKEFLTREREAEEEGEVEEEEDYEDDDEDDVSEGGTKPPPPPYWLPALLANDTFYLERILSTMYGWVIEPPSRVDPTLESIHAAEHPGLNEEEEGEERGEEEGEEHEEEEEEDEEDDYMGLGPKTKKTKRPFPPPSSVSANLAAETTGVYPDAPVESEGEPTTPHRRVGTAGPDASGSLTEVPQRTGGDVDGVKGDASHVQLMPVGEDAEDGAGTPPRNENLISTEDIGISQDDDLDGSPLARGRAASVDGVLAPAKSIATISHGRSSVSMHAFPPLTTIPAFPDVNYTFFIVWEVRAEEWHLLDMHPLLWVLRFKQDRERRQELRRERRAARDEEREANNHNDEEDDEEEEDEEEGEEEEEEDEEGGGNASLPSYDMSSIIVVDAFMLAALQSTTALRWTLLAKEQPPLLDHLQRWMELDMHAGFPILSSIYSALLNIRSKDVFRLSYRIHRLRLDFNLFFTSEYVFSLSSKRLLGSERNAVMEPADKEIDDIASHRSAHGRTLMQSLLKAGISATRPIELRKLDSLESVQLLLWLLMVMPKSELLEWGKMALRSRPDAVNGVAIEEEEEEEEDEEEGSITESLLKMRIKKMKRNDDKDYAATQAEGLQPGPLLLHTILEIRRRIAREKVGKAPSQHTLEMHLGENYRPELIEDGKPRGDALVTSSFILGVTAITTTSGKASRASFSASQSSTPVSVNMDDALTDSCNRIVRHQKLYQSDLVLLLLALTSTLLPRRLQKSLSQIENPHSAAEDARVMVRRVNRSSGSSSDAHADLFKAILAIKLNKIRSPLERVRSGTLRLLFLTLPRFRQTDTMQHLCDVTPLYEVLGVNERCPLPELVLAWSTERKDIHQHYLDIFVNTFWHELHYRMEDGLYEPNTIFLIKTRLIALLEKVKERFGQYQYVLSLLTGGIGAQSHKRLGSAPAGAAASTTAATAAGSGRPGRTPRSVRGMSLVEIGADLASQIISRSSPPTIRLPSPRPFSASVKNTSMASVLHRHPSPPHFTASNNASSAPITVSHPSPYSIDFLKEVARVRAVFESLPMSARSYYIPETLHALLFKNPRIDPVIIRFVMVEQQVCTVRENPFQRSEVPVLEETIRTHNFAATKMVVGLGAPMTDLVDEGTLTLGALAEQTFDASEMEVLRQLWSFNESTMASDPAVQYSVLRMVGCGS